MDRLTCFEIFIRASELGSFTAAGDSMAMSSQLVGKYIAALEQELGVRLINRTTRQQSLTDAGVKFYPRAKKILEYLAEAKNELDIEPLSPKGKLRISAPVNFSIYSFTPKLKSYLESFKDISIELTSTDRNVDLIAEGFDAAFIYGEPQNPSLVAIPLAPAKSFICASPKYLSNLPPPSSPSELSNHECITAPSKPTNELWKLTDKNGDRMVIPVSGRVVIENPLAQLMATLEGSGISLLPEELVSQSLKTHTLTRVLPDWSGLESSFHLVYSANRVLTPGLKTFLIFARQSFGLTIR